MKKTLLFLLLFTGSHLYAQPSLNAVKLGLFIPSAMEQGFIIGYEGGRAFDRNFDIGWSIDWFHKNYVDRGLEQQFNAIYGIPGGTINELRAKTNVHSFPVMVTATGRFPFGNRSAVFVTGGIGAEALLIFYRNFQNTGESEFTGAFDFNWRIGAGVVFGTGSNTEVFGELTYHHSNPSWEYEVDDSRYGIKRVFERTFDMSGMMMRVGFRFYH